MIPAATARCRTETDHGRRRSERHRRDPPIRRAAPAQQFSSRRVLLAAVALTFLLLVAMPSRAADERPTGGRVPTVTRLVALYLDREAALGDAIRGGDASALANLLTDDFELRAGA